MDADVVGFLVAGFIGAAVVIVLLGYLVMLR